MFNSAHGLVTGPGATDRSMKVLLVEDEAKIADFVRSGLTERGFDVEICSDGNSG